MEKLSAVNCSFPFSMRTGTVPSDSPAQSSAVTSYFAESSSVISPIPRRARIAFFCGAFASTTRFSCDENRTPSCRTSVRKSSRIRSASDNAASPNAIAATVCAPFFAFTESRLPVSRAPAGSARASLRADTAWNAPVRKSALISPVELVTVFFFLFENLPDGIRSGFSELP